MSVVTVNVWTCDFCGAVKALAKPTVVYSDPVVHWPAGWGSKPVPEEQRKHPTQDIADACPECKKAP